MHAVIAERLADPTATEIKDWLNHASRNIDRWEHDRLCSQIS